MTMGDSNPSFPSPDVADAVLATKLRGIERDVGDVRASVADLGRLATEMRIFMAESRATMAARDKADIELRASIGKLESRVEGLESFRWKILVAIASAGALGGGISEILGLFS